MCTVEKYSIGYSFFKIAKCGKGENIHLNDIALNLFTILHFIKIIIRVAQMKSGHV